MKTIKYVIALMVFATALSAQAEPLLNGLALEQQFNKDRYIVAVYSDVPANTTSLLLDNNTNRRIEVRIVADSLSSRSLRNQWVESIAINNPGDTLSNQAENMVAFANLLKGRLYQGDQLSVDFSGESGVTTIALDGVALRSIDSRNFFNTLLRAWVGPVPPSTDFREALLAAGEVSGSLLDRYELLAPSEGRIEEVRTSYAAPPESEQTASQESVATAPAVTTTAAPARPELAAEIPPPSLASLQPTPSPAPNTAPPQRSEPQPAAPPPEEATPESEIEAVEEEEEAPITVDILLARQVYQAVLARHTFKHIRYPKRAQERGQEGSVRLKVIINSRGYVTEVQTMQESRFGSLNRAAVAAVETAAPYPAVPPQLAQDTYEFTLPITFRLPD
ncbi:TonB family protein [Microbulbifer sp. TYP-18]|uniref:TonB family protein n=1 Tax=Microbulbifer sp. TYP-18 TaxID=3230024 RepID=UPI0034C5E56D